MSAPREPPVPPPAPRREGLERERNFTYGNIAQMRNRADAQTIPIMGAVKMNEVELYATT